MSHLNIFLQICDWRRFNVYIHMLVGLVIFFIWNSPIGSSVMLSEGSVAICIWHNYEPQCIPVVFKIGVVHLRYLAIKWTLHREAFILCGLMLDHHLRCWPNFKPHRITFVSWAGLWVFTRSAHPLSLFFLLCSRLSLYWHDDDVTVNMSLGLSVSICHCQCIFYYHY